jgi:hypothetical protein
MGKASNQIYRIPYMMEMYRFTRNTTGTKKHSWKGLTSASNRTTYTVTVLLGKFQNNSTDLSGENSCIHPPTAQL